ncbi:MAG: hypothetical protein FD174_4060 [Geobacteraceae bacterium]|nr:MAG: hypothetical protein FD174_4060 [Geobacteraceae bacterium]
MADSANSKGWRAALAGTGINLARRDSKAKAKASAFKPAAAGAFMENFIKGCSAFFFGFSPAPYRTVIQK